MNTTWRTQHAFSLGRPHKTNQGGESPILYSVVPVPPALSLPAHWLADLGRRHAAAATVADIRHPHDLGSAAAPRFDGTTLFVPVTESRSCSVTKPESHILSAFFAGENNAMCQGCRRQVISGTTSSCRWVSWSVLISLCTNT